MVKETASDPTQFPSVVDVPNKRKEDFGTKAKDAEVEA